MSSLIRLLDKKPAVAAETYQLPEEKRLVGNPLQTLWLEYTDASNQFFSGVWRSEPGKWRIHYTEEEYCCIHEGISIVTDAEGQAVRLKAGDEFVIPQGFTGTWEVVETTTKRFVIFEKASAN